MNVIPQLILNSIIAGSIYSLIAISFSLIYNVTKFFNLAHGVLAIIGGYTVFYFAQILNWNIYIAITFGIVFAGFIGLILDKIIYLPLRRRKASNMILLVASLGIMTALQALLSILFTNEFRTLSRNINEQKIFQLLNGSLTQTQVIIIFVAILITIFIVLLLFKTQFGKAIRAISDDDEVAKIVGINTDKIISYVFFLGSAIAGVAGILMGFDIGIEPTMGLNLLLKGIVAVIIGGIGNVYGSVLGAFVLGFAENFSMWKIAGEWKDAVAFILLIIFLLFKPRGIMNK